MRPFLLEDLSSPRPVINIALESSSEKSAATYLDECQIELIQVRPLASQVGLLGRDPDGDPNDEVPDT